MFKTEPIKEFLKQKTPKEKIVFEIKYNKKENSAINNLKLENEGNLRYAGDLDTLINDKKLDFLYNIGTNENKLIITIQQIIYKLIQKITKCYNYTHFLLLIRIVLSPYDFLIPRWHFDGPYFQNNPNTLTAKFITVLKGDGTLFFQNNKKAFHIYSENFEKIFKKMRKKILTNPSLKQHEVLDEIEQKNHPTLIKKLSICKQSQLKKHHGLIFIRDEFIHSEPKITEPRFFISILPSSKENIDELKIRWKL